jgi:hypothetical protein
MYLGFVPNYLIIILVSLLFIRTNYLFFAIFSRVQSCAKFVISVNYHVLSLGVSFYYFLIFIAGLADLLYNRYFRSWFTVITCSTFIIILLWGKLEVVCLCYWNVIHLIIVILTSLIV